MKKIMFTLTLITLVTLVTSNLYGTYVRFPSPVPIESLEAQYPSDDTAPFVDQELSSCLQRKRAAHLTEEQAYEECQKEMYDTYDTEAGEGLLYY